jgi:hypothetical protein
MPICHMRGRGISEKKNEKIRNGRGRGYTVAAAGAVVGTVGVVDIERAAGVVCSDDAWVETGPWD